jgi:hypothetical protein
MRMFKVLWVLGALAAMSVSDAPSVHGRDYTSILLVF